MAKSNLTIHKEIEMEKHLATPLGQAEHKIKKFYDCVTELPKEFIAQVNAVRGRVETEVGAYVNERMKIDKDYIDDILLRAMTEEVNLLENYQPQIGATPKE